LLFFTLLKRKISLNLAYFTLPFSPSRDRDVPLHDAHQVAQHGLGLDEPQPNVRGQDPILQDLVGEEVLGRGAALSEGNHDLAVFNRQNLGELRRTDHLRKSSLP